MQRRIAILFIIVITACIINFFLFRDESLIRYCDNGGSPRILCHLFQAIYGHFMVYLNFYYVIYGVLIGVFILYSYRALKAIFGIEVQRINDIDLSMMPFVNIITSLVVAYVICLLIEFGKFDIQVFDLKLSDYPTSGSIGFLLGLFITLGVRKYLSMLIGEPNNSLNSDATKSGTPLT